MSTKIYVVSHKNFILPTDDSLYIPIMVGKGYTEIVDGAITDNTGDNIAKKNDLYNELTALYWIWKNSDADIVGLCHYRRYFTTAYGKLSNVLSKKNTGFLDEKYIIKALKKNELVVHNKTFFPNGNLRQLERKDNLSEADNKSKLDRKITQIAVNTFEEIYPEDYKYFKKVMNGTQAHLLNIVIGRKNDIDRYCEWLFPYLFALEDKLLSKYNRNELSRVIGLVAERMIDVWILKNCIKYKECFTVNTERVDLKIFD